MKDFDLNSSEEFLSDDTSSASLENSADTTETDVYINLDGGVDPKTSVGDTSRYTENIRSSKKGFRRPVAFMVLLTFLNLAILGSTFALGLNFGKIGRSVTSRQELVESMQADPADNGIVAAVSSQNEKTTTEIAKEVGPAVVGITSTTQGQMSIFGTTSQSEAEGSGIILSADGYIVTNNHVVDRATTVKVTLNTGAEYDATLVGKDEQTDLAVIKIEPTEELTVATMGDSNTLEVGERVVAIGNPMGLEFFGSVTEGIVSAVNRSIAVDNRTMNVIQTDAAINSGNSGGALINTKGEVIGINSIKVSYSGVEGMGFAIPSSEAKPIIADLLEHGYVKGRPIIGISTRDVTSYMAQSYSWPEGVQVMEVSSEAAKSAGLQQGDIITHVGGQKIKTGEELNKIKSQHNPGEALPLKVYKYATGLTVDTEVILSEQLPG